ncbi:MAG: hypothetical protein ABUL62_11520 [Myxococcales bacterium]|jgi:hypothetical protein
MREIEHERRAKVVQRLTELGVLLKAAREARRDSIDRIRLQCRKAREKLRNVCGVRRERARREGTEVVNARAREIHEERHLDKLQRTTGKRSTRVGSKPIGRVRNTGRERESESDDAVRRDIPPELVGVFNKVRRNIKGTDRRTRSEAFLEWAEENPGEIYAMQEQEAAREIKRLVKEYQREAAGGGDDHVPF